MNDNEVHIGLEKSELRDFFSYQLGKLGQEIPKKSPKVVNNDYIQYGIDECNINIEYYTEKKKKYVAIKSLTYLMKQYGWSEHDISDQTIKTNDFYIHFIGTEEEYNSLLQKIK